MSSISLIRRPRFVVLDTSHYVELVADSISNNLERRRTAQRFIPDLVDKGWLPLLCWHHVEELLQHRDDQLVEARLQYLWSLPLVAWIKPTDPLAGLGSILDVFRTEVLVAHQNLGADAIKVRDLTRQELFSVGSGLAAIPKDSRNWAVLRSALEAQQQNARRITAISRWRATDIDDTLISEWIDRPVREKEDAARVLAHLRNDLAREIAKRGDKRIPDPSAMATAFIAQVAHDGHAVVAAGHPFPAIQLLISAGLELEDIDPSATFRETMDLLAFHKRLRIVAETSSLPWADLKRNVARQQLPAIVIEERMRRYAHDQLERKGSDLNDTHLLCLAPYSDMTYVDKRTLESVRRARSKAPDFDSLIRGIARATSYREIAEKLSAV